MLSIHRMEPLLISESSKHYNELSDLALALTAKSSGFKRSLPESMLKTLSELIRSMNCYYSNLIEGHNTHPVDIERALQGDYSAQKEKRDLQLEAKAHITVQRWIDGGGIKNNACTVESLCEIHRRFCDLLPPEMLMMVHPKTQEEISLIPGAYRQHDVEVGKHIAVPPDAIDAFMKRFEKCYADLGVLSTVMNMAAAHHRLLWIHPFLDGNGRVARLMSHAMLLDTLDTGSIWSVSRGLARNQQSYKNHLIACDLPRRNDLDGRGHLSEETLASFSRFFLNTCLDQIEFMEQLIEPGHLRHRILSWIKEQIEMRLLPKQSERLLEVLLYKGELQRAEVPGLLGVTDRQARRVVADLISHDVITSISSRAPLCLKFPAKYAANWMPGLFPEN